LCRVAVPFPVDVVVQAEGDEGSRWEVCGKGANSAGLLSELFAFLPKGKGEACIGETVRVHAIWEVESGLECEVPGGHRYA